jgi:hypothetical protein
MQPKDEAIEEMQLRRMDIEDVREQVDRLKPVGKSSGWSSVAASLLSLSAGSGITAWVEGQAVPADRVKVGVYLTAAVLMLIGAGLAWMGHLSVSKRVTSDVEAICKKLDRILDSYESTLSQKNGPTPARSGVPSRAPSGGPFPRQRVVERLTQPSPRERPDPGKGEAPPR